MIGVDTFSWKKYFILRNSEWKDLMNEILEISNFFITHSVKKEFEYFFPKKIHLLKHVTILPDIDEIKDEFLKRGFDNADASLLEYTERKSFTIITEDHQMIEESVFKRNNIIQLADFFGILFIDGFFTLKEFYHIVRKLREMKNITKKKEKKLLDLRN